MLPEPITVLVTAIGGAGYGDQILKALRLAGRYRIVGADASAECPQFSLVDQPLVLPRADDPVYVDAVLAVCARFGIRAVFHGCEPELRVLSANRERFAEKGIMVPLGSPEVIDLCMNKLATAEFLRKHGFHCPRTTTVSHGDELMGVDWLPVIVKPYLGGGGSRNCYIAQTRRELELLRELVGGEGAAMMVQEYVGTSDSEYTVGVLHDLDGNFINSIAVHRRLSGQLDIRLAARNLTRRRSLGDRLVVSSGFSHGDVGPFPEVAGACEQIAAALGAQGSVNIQCRVVDGQVYVFEINPRLSGTTSLRALMGFNEPDVLIRRHVLGEKVATRFPYRSGLVLRSLVESVVAGEPVADWRALV